MGLLLKSMFLCLRRSRRRRYETMIEPLAPVKRNPYTSQTFALERSDVKIGNLRTEIRQ